MRGRLGKARPYLFASECKTSTLFWQHQQTQSLVSRISVIPSLYTADINRRYLEAVERLDNILTFSFTDLIVARDFLARHSDRTIRNVEISLRLKPLFTELYFPGPDGEPQPHIDGLPVTAKNNPWEDLCRRVAALPNLRQLHVYLDSEDLRPWHKRVNERKFLDQLTRARALSYVLYLPEIPDEPELCGLPGSYLLDDDDHDNDGSRAVVVAAAAGDEKNKTKKKGAPPFRIVRGPRPNNWQLHLSRVSLLQLVRRH